MYLKQDIFLETFLYETSFNFNVDEVNENYEKTVGNKSMKTVSHSTCYDLTVESKGNREISPGTRWFVTFSRLVLLFDGTSIFYVCEKERGVRYMCVVLLLWDNTWNRRIFHSFPIVLGKVMIDESARRRPLEQHHKEVLPSIEMGVGLSIKAKFLK